MLEYIITMFYFSAFIPLTFKIATMLHPVRAIVIRKFLITDRYEEEGITQDQVLYLLCQLYYVFWVFLGVFSSQALLFLIIIVFGCITNGWDSPIWVCADAIISIGLILLIILNKYTF